MAHKGKVTLRNGDKHDIPEQPNGKDNKVVIGCPKCNTTNAIY
jgi:hypothetical protein